MKELDTEKKLRKLAELWCSFNRCEMSGNDFAVEFGELFWEDLLKDIWNEKHRFIKK